MTGSIWPNDSGNHVRTLLRTFNGKLCFNVNSWVNKTHLCMLNMTLYLAIILANALPKLWSIYYKKKCLKLQVVYAHQRRINKQTPWSSLDWRLSQLKHHCFGQPSGYADIHWVFFSLKISTNILGQYHFLQVRNRRSSQKNSISFNPLNAELNPIRHLLALVGTRHIVHVSRLRVNSGTWNLDPKDWKHFSLQGRFSLCPGSV